ncbi:hypothetical protein Anapl_07278 [Anas platyrhynchos]|uniref:Uncharacterized protein n=1 Tax=Anas platyrhynchos TaxID=8839 RepID=R0JDQ4_ANAPL|nr:hypothetical protein Anapl_07278 [Anas platyrhynchos]
MQARAPMIVGNTERFDISLLRAKESVFRDWNSLSQLHLSPFNRKNGRKHKLVSSVIRAGRQISPHFILLGLEVRCDTGTKKDS